MINLQESFGDASLKVTINLEKVLYFSLAKTKFEPDFENNENFTPDFLNRHKLGVKKYFNEIWYSDKVLLDGLKLETKYFEFNTFNNTKTHKKEIKKDISNQYLNSFANNAIISLSGNVIDWNLFEHITNETDLNHVKDVKHKNYIALKDLWIKLGIAKANITNHRSFYENFDIGKTNEEYVINNGEGNILARMRRYNEIAEKISSTKTKHFIPPYTAPTHTAQKLHNSMLTDVIPEYISNKKNRIKKIGVNNKNELIYAYVNYREDNNKYTIYNSTEHTTGKSPFNDFSGFKNYYRTTDDRNADILHDVDFIFLEFINTPLGAIPYRIHRIVKSDNTPFRFNDLSYPSLLDSYTDNVDEQQSYKTIINEEILNFSIITKRTAVFDEIDDGNVNISVLHNETINEKVSKTFSKYAIFKKSVQDFSYDFNGYRGTYNGVITDYYKLNHDIIHLKDMYKKINDKNSMYIRAITPQLLHMSENEIYYKEFADTLKSSNFVSTNPTDFFTVNGDYYAGFSVNYYNGITSIGLKPNQIINVTNKFNVENDTDFDRTSTIPKSEVMKFIDRVKNYSDVTKNDIENFKDLRMTPDEVEEDIQKTDLISYFYPVIATSGAENIVCNIELLSDEQKLKYNYEFKFVSNKDQEIDFIYININGRLYFIKFKSNVSLKEKQFITVNASYEEQY